MGREEVHRTVVFEEVDVWMCGDSGEQSAFDFVSRCISMMKNSALRVPPLAAQVLACDLAKLDTELWLRAEAPVGPAV